MKPESASYLDTAHDLIREARSILAINLPGQAGRSAYIAALNAARAYVFERSDRVVKTHKGTHDAFYLVSAEDTRIEAEFRTFLPRSYRRKTVSDYGAGSERQVTWGEASTALETATRFVTHIATILAIP